MTSAAIPTGSGLSTGGCYANGYGATAFAKADLVAATAPPAIPGIVGPPLHVERR